MQGLRVLEVLSTDDVPRQESWTRFWVSRESHSNDDDGVENVKTCAVVACSVHINTDRGFVRRDRKTQDDTEMLRNLHQCTMKSLTIPSLDVGTLLLLLRVVA